VKVLSDFQGVVEGILKSRIYIKMGYDVAVSCGNFCTFTFALCIFAHLLSLCSERNTKASLGMCGFAKYACHYAPQDLYQTGAIITFCDKM
jgi:hypothetical protein